MQTQQILVAKSSPNTQFNYFDCDCDFPQIESETLQIGEECINFCGGDAKKAIEKFEIHKTEIILTYLHNLLASQKDPQDAVFKQVLEFIQIEDGA